MINPAFMNDLFDHSLFAHTEKPFPNLVFAKNFDAYFFVQYPHNAYQQEGPLNPFSFLNNIDEKTVFICNPSGSVSMEHTVHHWDSKAFLDTFEKTCSRERYQKSLIADPVIETLVTTLSDIGFAKRVHRLEQPGTYANFQKDKPLGIEDIYSVLPKMLCLVMSFIIL